MPALRLLACCLLVLLPLAAPPVHASEPFPARGEGVYRTPEGDLLAVDVTWTGPCNGEGVLTLTADSGASWSATLASAMTADACEAVGPSCHECPPLPLPVAWTMEGEDAFLAGGGVVYVWSTDAWDVAWSVQGSFLGGWLEFRPAVDA